MRGLGQFLGDAWRLTKPYFNSEERWSARGLLATIITLNLSLVGMDVVLSFWNRDFYNALQDKDWDAFIGLLFFYRRTPSGFMPGFCEVAAVYIVVAVYRTYLNQWLQIRWRRWMTERFLEELAGRPRLLPHQPAPTDGAATAAIGTDNPDQRIAEDIRDFVDRHALAGPRPAVQRRHAGQLRRHPVVAVRHRDAVRHRHPRLHGLGGAGLRHRRHLADPSGRPSAGGAAISASSGWRPISATPGAACARTWKASRCTTARPRRKRSLGASLQAA